MPEGLTKILEPFLALSPVKRWVVVGVVGLSLLAFTLLILAANRTDYRPLFTNLNNDDAGEIVKKLKEQKIPYQISSEGKAILVPSDKVYDLRLSLASDGLPQGGGVGFEIFDRKNFGATEFVQKLNYQRALQGELSRTIGQISGVDQARVHIAIPEKSLFRDNEKPPTASVVLRMKASRTLTDSEVQGIVRLVSASIEGMDPDNVTVLDSRGKILSKGGPSDATGKMTSTMLETQHNYEKNLEDRLQSLLDKAVGSGKSVARVTATFDFKQVERFEEKYDPDTVVRSEQRSEEKNNGMQTASGTPGVQTNLGRNTGAGTSTSGGGSKNDETMNYEVSRATSRTIEPVGTLSKLAVAILVDGKYDTPAAGKAGAPAKAKYVARTPEELQKLETLIKTAVGFSADRGDQVTVANIPFQDAEEGSTSPEGWWNQPIAMSLLKNGIIGLGFLALLFFVIRPLLNSTLGSAKKSTVFEPLDSSPDQLDSAEVQQQLALQKMTQIDLIDKVKQDPYQAAQILQNWLAEKE